MGLLLTRRVVYKDNYDLLHFESCTSSCEIVSIHRRVAYLRVQRTRNYRK
jgi:hypothetical protein